MITSTSLANHPTKKMIHHNQENIPSNISSKDIMEKQPKEQQITRQVGKDISNTFEESEAFKVKKEVAKPKCFIDFFVENKKTADTDIIPNIRSKFDEAIKNNPQYVYDYSLEIFDSLKQQEAVNSPDYISIELIQQEITQNRRRILVEWLMKVHSLFKLLTETLFIAINIMDRYLSLVDVPLNKFQLLGMTSLFIASKYEDIYPPEIKEFLCVIQNTNKDDVLHMEGEILTKLDFDILSVSAYTFLKRYHFLSGCNEEVLHLANLILELNFLSLQAMNYPNSLKASCVLYISLQLLKMESDKWKMESQSISNIWSNSLRLQTGYQLEDMKGCRNSLFQIIKAQYKESNIIIKKYSNKSHSNVGRFFKQSK